MSSSGNDSDSNSPLYKKTRNMAGRGGKRNLERRNSMENLTGGAVKDILDALEALRGELKTQIAGVNDKLGRLEALSSRVQAVEVKMGTWERRCKQAEVEEKRKWTVIRGLWKQEEVVGYETRDQLRTSLDEMKELMGVELRLMDYYRLKDIQRNKKSIPGLVKVKFITSDDKDYFFSKVPVCGQKDDLKNLSFQQDVPSFLVEKYKRLDGLAFKLRKSDKVKTRVVPRGLDLQLQKRTKEAGSRWETVEEGNQPAEASASGWTED